MFSFSRRPHAAPATAGPCFHCGLPLPDTPRDWVAFDDRDWPVCCPACAAVAQFVLASGYGDYYRERLRLGASIDA